MHDTVATARTIPSHVRTLANTVAVQARARFGQDLRVYWFGSWATGKARPHSDIDLALASTAALPNRDLATLRDWIDDLPTLYSIDVLDLNQVGDILRRRIEAEGMQL